MTLQPSATFHLHSETATTGEESQPWFAMEASIISALSTIPRLPAFATSLSTVVKASARSSRWTFPSSTKRLPVGASLYAPQGSSRVRDSLSMEARLRRPNHRAGPAAGLVRILVDGDPYRPCLRRRRPGCTVRSGRRLLERPDLSKRSWHGRQVRSKRADFAGSGPSVLRRRSCRPAPYRTTREGLTPNTRLELRRPAVMVQIPFVTYNPRRRSAGA